MSALFRRQRLAELLDRKGSVSPILRWRAKFPAHVLTVVSYHRVLPHLQIEETRFDEHVIDASVETFRTQLTFMKSHFSVVSLATLMAFVDGEKLPPNPLLVTFDDGYRDNVDFVLPELVRAQLAATFFVATDYLTKRKVFWWDLVAYLVKSTTKPRIEMNYPRHLQLDLTEREKVLAVLLAVIKTTFALDLNRFLAELADTCAVAWGDAEDEQFAHSHLMTWDDVRTLKQANMTIGSHTRSHRVLQTLPQSALDDELSGSRDDLVRELGEAPLAIAYPTGKPIYDDAGLRAAVTGAGYRLGFSYKTGAMPLWQEFDALNVRRLAVDLGQSGACFRGTLALPFLSATRRQR